MLEENLILILKKNIKFKYDFDFDEISLNIPPKKEMWDYTFLPFSLAKHLKLNPSQIISDLAELLSSEKSLEFAKVEWNYLNIKLSTDNYSELFNDLYNNKEQLIWNNVYNWKTIVIDYIWANVWKPLHIAHMCTPNQWQVLINLYRKLGYKVIADTHIWDWWIIFWKLITAYKLWWDRKKLEENTIDYLLELYIKITAECEKDESLEQATRDEFKFLSEWNSQSVELWKEFTSYSIKSIQVQLDRLNIKPDYNIGESFYEWLNLPKIGDYPDLKYTMKDIVKELVKKWIAIKNDDNSVWVEFDEDLKIPSCILQKRDRTHGYLASDLSAIKYRIDNWNPLKIVYFVDTRQQLHLRQVFEIAKKAWWIKENPPVTSDIHLDKVGIELFHAYNWYISLKDWAMSTRKWKIIRLDKLLDEAELRAKNIILEKRNDIVWVELDNLSKIIWIWAIKYWYLKKSRETDIIFDWDEFMTFEWNSWPYIQYSYVRAIRLLEKNEFISNSNIINCNCNFEFTEEVELVKILSNYTDILEKTAKFNMPHYLCNYAYDLTKTFSSFYNNVQILRESDENKKICRLKLVELYSLVLKDSFKILGIEMPDKM